MTSAAVTTQDVIGMASRMGFRHGKNEKGIPVLTYSTPTGFVMEFPVPWLKPDGLYINDQVSTQLKAMLTSAKMDEDVYNFLRDKSNQEKINKACLDYGMVYDDTDHRFYYVEKGNAVFGVDHDYIASLICTGKASIDHVKDILDTFKETAEFEHKQSIKASGQELLGKDMKGKKRNGSKGRKKAGKNRR